MTGWLRGTRTALVAVVLLVGACGAPAESGSPDATPGASSASAPPAAAETGPAVVGPVAFEPIAIDPAGDPPVELIRSEAAELVRLRTEAGFPREVGSGWRALSSTVDETIDAAVRDVAAQLGVDVPIANRDGRLASIDVRPPAQRPVEASPASAMAMVTAGIFTGKGLGNGGTTNASSSESKTTTDGDDVVTVTVKMTGTVTSTASRAVGEFTFELTGDVSNAVSGATAHMTGSATAHDEIDGCPDKGGTSKGKMSLSSKEGVSGHRDGTDESVSWTRDISGDFDIKVDDEANIAGLVVDAKAQELVQESKREAGSDDADTHGHDLGVSAHVEFTSGPGFKDFAADDSKGDGALLNQKNATKADLEPLFRSIGRATATAAVMMGGDAEKFWRDGKCIEVKTEPGGGEVDPASTTSLTAKVRQIFEGAELDKPVEATLTGVASIDPSGSKVPSPATFTYTAGSKASEVGEVTFKSISNRGIGETSVKFAVIDQTIEVSLTGTMTTSALGVSYVTKVAAPKIALTSQGDGSYVGEGPAKATITMGIADCSKPYTQKGTMKLHATRPAAGDPALPRDWTVTWDPLTQYTTTGSCLGVPLESFTGTGSAGPTGGFMFVLGDVVIPASGGTRKVHLSKALGASTKHARCDRHAKLVKAPPPVLSARPVASAQVFTTSPSWTSWSRPTRCPSNRATAPNRAAVNVGQGRGGPSPRRRRRSRRDRAPPARHRSSRCCEAGSG